MDILEVATPDGTCRTALFGQGQPGVILIIDAAGPRNALFDTADKFAAAGFSVALPDLMYRVGSPFDLFPPGTPHDPGAFFGALRSDPDFRKQLTEKYIRSANAPEHVARDFGALLPALAPRFAPGRVRLVGYCMGGGIALRAAALFPERVCAVASFHGGFLATTAPESPHLGVPQLRAELLVAGAEEDGSFSAEIRDRLVGALQAAGTRHRVETWPGKHGFAVTDSPVYDPALYERHLRESIELFKRAS